MIDARIRIVSNLIYQMADPGLQFLRLISQVRTNAREGGKVQEAQLQDEQEQMQVFPKIWPLGKRRKHQESSISTQNEKKFRA